MRIITLYCLFYLALTNSGHGTELATFQEGFTLGSSNFTTIHSVNFRLFYTEESSTSTPVPNTILFEDVATFVTPLDIGTTYKATATSDAEFDGFEQFLTNGVNDRLAISMSVNTDPDTVGRSKATCCTNAWENHYSRFAHTPFVVNGIDFKGFDIESVTFTIDSITFDNDFRIKTARAQVTVTINSVPEPSALANTIVGCLISGILFRSRRAPLDQF